MTVTRSWKRGDKVEIVLPMHTTIEQLPNVPEYIAFMHGPILLGAKTGTEDLDGLKADDSRWGHIAHGRRLPIDKAPIIVEKKLSEITKKFRPEKYKPLTFTVPTLNMINPQKIVLEPFLQIHDARYIIYWMAFSNSRYHTYLDSLADAEKKALALQRCTVDYVATGEQQPEADHLMEESNSNSGVHLDEFWRDARKGGYFSYRLSTNGETNLSLMVRYWGYEGGSRIFDIYIDHEKLIAENNTGRWYQSQYQEVVYPIPKSMLKGKDHFRVKFQAAPNSTAGAVYYVRLVRPEEIK